MHCISVSYIARLIKDEMDAGKTVLDWNKKINSIESLPQLVDKLYINKNRRRNIANKLNKESVTLEKIIEPVHDFKRTTIPLYNIEEMSFQELKASLCEIEEKPQQPFAFLANISKAFTEEDRISVQPREPTEIDIRLSVIAKRIESSKALLEKTKARVKEIYFHAKQDSIVNDINTQS